MFFNKVEICGVNTSKLPLLSESEKERLLDEIERGNQEARELFINGNLRLVLSVIQRFGNRGENADDLFQVGCIGLIKSLDNFDRGQGVRFSTYAVPMILGEIRRYLRDNNSIRVSRSVKDIAYRALQVRERVINETSKEPTTEDIARELGVQREDVVMAIDSIQEPISLFESVYHDGTDPVFIMDQIKDDKNIDEDWATDIALKDAIKKLTVREKNIINLRYFEGKTQMEVAEEIGISQAQVSRLEKSAIQHISKHIG